jgi:hypothetical protein
MARFLESRCEGIGNTWCIDIHIALYAACETVWTLILLLARLGLHSDNLL